MKKPLIEEISRQLRIMSTEAVMRSQVIAEKLGINTTDLEMLEVLLREGKTTAGKLAEHTGLTTGAVTGVIDRLAAREFAAREADPKDRRKVMVALNMKKITEQVMPLYVSLSNSMNMLAERYSERDLRVIVNFLKKANYLSHKDLEMIRK